MDSAATFTPGTALALPGKIFEFLHDSAVISRNLLTEFADWAVNVNRLRIEKFTKTRFPDCYERLDGGDLRLMRAFVEPEFVSNTCSLLGRISREVDSELRAPFGLVLKLLIDALGPDSAHDTSFVKDQPDARKGKERWFFVNGIATSRDLAWLNVQRLSDILGGKFTLIHNPTQGLVNDLVESTLQKFTNINTEPAARAFIEIADAILDPHVEKVIVVAHSQGTIVIGDVLDLLYCAVDRKYFDRTNMNDADYDEFMNESHGTVKSHELRQRNRHLKGRQALINEKLELYMFANAASRMCYLDEDKHLPHIESFANEHDIVTRLGSLARDEFHEEDIVRVHGPLYLCRRYGHLLNAHYLPGLVAGDYRLSHPQHSSMPPSVGRSVHDPVRGNPGARNPLWRSSQQGSRLAQYMARQRNPPAVQPPALQPKSRSNGGRAQGRSDVNMLSGASDTD